MRNITEAERAIIADPQGHWQFRFLEVTDFDGTWMNVGYLSVGERNADFLNSYDLDDDIDRNTLTFSALLRGSVGEFSIMPFRSDSPLNVDASDDYQPLLDLHRQWRLWQCIKPRNEFPSGPEEYRERARGVIDRLDLSLSRDAIRVQGRGPEADLIDDLVVCDETTPKVYAAGAVATVLQAMLDDRYGAGTYSLVVESSAPSEYIDEQRRTEPFSFWKVFSDVAALGTGVVRFKYDSSDNLAIHLFTPDRSATVPQWSISVANELEDLDNGLDQQTVANYIVVRFVNASGAIETVTSPTVDPAITPTASSARYGRKPAVLTLAQNSGINDATRAQALANAIRADKELPILGQVATSTGLWFGELWDFVGTPANAVLYNEDQAGGVVGYHEHGENSETTNAFTLAGKPKGRYATWLDIGSTVPVTVTPPTVKQVDASWKTQLTGDAYRPGVVAVATVNDRTQSVKFELSETADFATVINTSYNDVTDGVSTMSWFGSLLVTPGTLYYVRATAFSGPLSTPAPTGPATGVEGDFLVGNSSNLVEPEDTPTVSWDLSESGKWKANLLSVPVDVLPTEVTDVIAGGSSEIGTPIWFYKSPKATDEHLDLTTIPAAATEILSEYRHREHALGAGRIRLHAHVQAKTGTPTLSVKSSTDDFATTPTDCVALSVTATGRLTSDWATLATASRDDVQFSAYAGDGADTASLELLALWAELLPDLVTAFRDFSDDFSDDFS